MADVSTQTAEPASLRRTIAAVPVLDIRNVALVVLATLATLAAFKLAADVLVPITLSISLGYVLMPLVLWMRRRLRIPEPLGAGIALVLLVVLIVVGAVEMQPRVSAILDTVPKATQRLGHLLHSTALEKTSAIRKRTRSEEHTSELQELMR